MNTTDKSADTELVVHLSGFGFRRLLRGWPVLVLASTVLLAALTGLGVVGSAWLATGTAFLGPSFAHPLGTNALGQDLLAHSCQALLALFVGVVPGALLGFGVGVAAGVCAGWRLHSALDQIICFACDLFEGLPSYLILVLLALLMQQAQIGTAILFAALFWPSAARALRVATSQVICAPFMDAAEQMGTSMYSRAWRHLLPNLRLVLAALALLILGSCIRAQMLLGFMGLDTQARPSLGAMIYSGTQDALSFHFTALLVALSLSMLILLALDSLARRLAAIR
jgi:ABC-type dipeptide/oligopeptide/nickel transport system permease subunit